MNRRLVTHVVVALSGILVGAGGFALAASSDEVIRACVKRGSGVLRLARTCGPKEGQVSWNVQGPEGQPGEQGPEGPQGARGARGPMGTTRPAAVAYVNRDGPSSRA